MMQQRSRNVDGRCCPNFVWPRRLQCMVRVPWEISILSDDSKGRSILVAASALWRAEAEGQGHICSGCADYITSSASISPVFLCRNCVRGFSGLLGFYQELGHTSMAAEVANVHFPRQDSGTVKCGTLVRITMATAFIKSESMEYSRIHNCCLLEFEGTGPHAFSISTTNIFRFVPVIASHASPNCSSPCSASIPSSGPNLLSSPAKTASSSDARTRVY